MRTLKLVMIFLAMICLSSSVASARILYVSPSGIDSPAWNGDINHPWKTLQYASNTSLPGDTINVEPGNYTGMIIDSTHSGTAASPITFVAQPGVSITTAGAWGDGIDCEGSSYITINGFTANNMARSGFRAVNDNGVVIENCKADSCGDWGILTGWANYLTLQGNVLSNTKIQHGIYVGNSSTNDNILNNVCYGNAGCGIHVNGDIGTQPGDGIIHNALIEGNVCYNNGSAGGAGINMSGVINSTICNNLLYGNLAGGFTMYGGGSGSGPSNDILENNTVIMPSNGRWACQITDGVGPITVRNNIFYYTSPTSVRGALAIDATSKPYVTSDYNILDDACSVDGGNSTISLSAWKTATGQDAHSMLVSSSTIAALFVNMAANNYHLSATSAAINIGTSVNAPTIDLDGNARPSGSGYDIGAYEYQFPLLAGDANGDGKVSFYDYLVLESNFGKTGTTWAMGDFNNDGKVSFADYLLLEANFGKSSSTPEPASLILMVAGGLGLLRRNGR